MDGAVELLAAVFLLNLARVPSWEPALLQLYSSTSPCTGIGNARVALRCNCGRHWRVLQEKPHRDRFKRARTHQMVQARRALQHPLRSLVQPEERGLGIRSPAWSWEQIYDSRARVYNVAASRSDAWRDGRVPQWWARQASNPKKPPPLQLTPAMTAQVDGILGQLRATLARNRERMIDVVRISATAAQPGRFLGGRLTSAGVLWQFQRFDVDNSGKLDR